MKKYSVLVFDLDDTLIDNKENVRFAFSKMSDYLDIPYSEDDFEKWLIFDKKFWKDFYDGKLEIPYDKGDDRFVPYVQSLRYFKFFEGKIDMDKALEVNELFLESLKERVFAIDGARETLEGLSINYKIYIATNGPRQAVKSKLEKIGVFKFVTETFSADMTKNVVTKPSEEYFMELIDFIGCSKDEVLMIGDSFENDISGALNVGIDSCWFDRKEETRPLNLNPTYVVENLRDLLSML